MIKKFLIIASIASVSLASCKKPAIEPPIEPAKTTNAILAPVGFKWENSRNLNLSISIAENKFPGKLYVVAIYTSDGVAGGKLLAKGSLTVITRFKTKLYLSNQVTELYIVCMAPDKTITTRNIKAGTADLDINMGA
ncbi:hypothetical protein [Pedobacter sp. JCM 36344]|uniref:hypothetical protein n=1 Tax=Pedobacter sp. JCM 36344 TaxID=3374280 RepID=UPI00397B01F4